MARIIAALRGASGVSAVVWHPRAQQIRPGMDTPPQQLDIFADSDGVRRRNDAIDSIEQGDAPAARTAVAALAAASPGDADLPAFERLVAFLEARAEAPLATHDSLATHREQLAGEIAGAARRVLGATAAEPWLQRQWRALATRSVTLPFVPARPEDHAAGLWLRSAAWAQAEQAAARIESWRRIPAPLGWMAEARCRQDRLDETWPLLAELAWLAPARLDALLRHLDDPLLRRLAQRFGASFEGNGGADDFAWFPAWVLTEQPALARLLAFAQPSLHSPAERAMRLLLELLGLERQGRHQELVPRRRALRDLHAPLYATYMATR